jgi:hypothetical protein
MSDHLLPSPRIERARSPRTDSDNSNRTSSEEPKSRAAASRSQSQSASPDRRLSFLQKDQLMPYLRKLRPTFVFTNDRALLNLFGGDLSGPRRPTARAEIFNPLGLSMTCSFSATQLARFLHLLSNTPLAIAGLLVAAKSLVDRSQRLREEREALKAWRGVEVEPAVPSDMGVEHALAMSIPLDSDPIDDSDDSNGDDEDEVSMPPSDWSFISEEFQDDENDAEVIDK